MTRLPITLAALHVALASAATYLVCSTEALGSALFLIH